MPVQLSQELDGNVARVEIFLFLIHKGMSFTCSLFCRTFSIKTWNFCGIWRVPIFKNGRKVEIAVVESFLFNYIVCRIVFTPTFLIEILHCVCGFLYGIMGW